MPTWTDAAKFRLLLSVIECMNIDKLPPWEDVAEKMGQGFTKEAVRQQFQKIRRDAKSDGVQNGTAPPATPKKGGKAAKKLSETPTSSSPKKRGRADGKSNGDFSGNEDEDLLTAKQAKLRLSATPKAKGTVQAKAEAENSKDEDDVGVLVKDEEI